MLEAQSDEVLLIEFRYAVGKPLGATWRPDPNFISMYDTAKALTPPPWFAGGFGVEGQEADFDYWSKMKDWDWDEATSLSIGFEPCGKIDTPDQDARVNPEVMEFYRRRRKVIGNNFYGFGDHTVFKPSPINFCKWAAAVRIEVPDGLHRAVMDTSGVSYELLGSAKAKSLRHASLVPRERESLLRLVIGMAIRGYGYQPTALRSEIPNQIRSDLLELGLDLHPDTIRSYLREAAAILPDDAKAEQQARRAKKRRPRAE